MSEKKIIEIRPELFNFDKKTRKKSKRLELDGGIKIKPSHTARQEATIKNRVMKYIRNQQEENYKKLFDPMHSQSTPTLPKELEPLELEDKTDFDKTLAYLKTVSDASKHKINTPSYTIKQYYPNTNQSVDYGNSNIQPSSISPPTTNEVITLLPNPTYGCLKNGNLPTYRMVNQTVKQYPHQHVGGTYVAQPLQVNMDTICPSGFVSNAPSPIEPMHHVQNQSNEETPIHLIENIEDTMKYDNLQQRLKSDKLREKKKELILKVKEDEEARKIMHAERGGQGSLTKPITNKKTIRRVYNVGKSGVVRKVGVLVSSQGYRNTVLTKKKTLKTESIGRVNKYLCDKGLIKVGSTAPEEVLRELYENAELVGNLQNHNVENLLHNYVHG